MQRFHGDEEDALVDGVYLNEESLTQITRLFKVGNPAGPWWGVLLLAKWVWQAYYSCH